MFSSFFSGGVPRFGFGKLARSGSGIDIPPVTVYDVEVSTEKRDRRLKHLLKLNHSNFSILYNQRRFHNHTPHILGSAYLLDGSAEHLTSIYEHASTHEGLEPWKDSPGEIALHDYRDFLGKKEYQRAWVDFFEDQLVQNGYEWKNVVEQFLFDNGSKSSASPLPIFNSLVGGLGHPLIHLGYAYELNSREVAMEAMGLAATCYDTRLAELLESGSETSRTSTANPLTYSTSNIFEVIARCNSDTRLNQHFTKLGDDNLSRLLADDALTSILLEHWNAWKITDPRLQFEQSQQLAAALLISTSPKTKSGNLSNTNTNPKQPEKQHNQHYGYDFFLLHLLTTSHAVRILLPFLSPERHLPLVREWWLITLAIYIAQLQPLIDLRDIQTFDLKGRDWAYTAKMALESEHKFDEHYVKGIRALKEADELWGDYTKKGSVSGNGQTSNDARMENYWLKAAVKFASEFDGWYGFREEEGKGESGMEREQKGE